MAMSQTEIIDDNGLKILNNESINEKLISIITEIIKDIRLAIINNEGIDKELISKITEIARKSDSLICKVRQIILKDIENGIYEWLDYIYTLYYYPNDFYGEPIIIKNDIINMIPLIIKKDSRERISFFNKLEQCSIALPNYELIKSYETKIAQLEHQNKLLQTQLDYAPDGPGYEESKEHFESLLGK